MKTTNDTFQHEMLMLVFRMSLALVCVSVKAETPTEADSHRAAQESEAQRLHANTALVATNIAAATYSVVLPGGGTMRLLFTPARTDKM